MNEIGTQTAINSQAHSGPSPLEVYITVNEPEATQDKGKFGLKVILGS